MNVQLSKILLLSALLVTAAVSAAAQTVFTPEKNSPERKAIFDALRVPVEKELHQPIFFVADDLNVSGSWAFVGGTPHNADGGMPDYSRTRYARARAAGAFDNNFFALLKQTAGVWHVVTYRIGCTDVCYLGWQRTYRAPKAIFPYTGQ